MQSSFLKNHKDFEKLKDMLIQDAEINNMNVGFFDGEPEDYPCLVKINEINHQILDLNFEDQDQDEYEDEDQDIEEMMEGGIEYTNGYYYEFFFITQREIKQLLEI